MVTLGPLPTPNPQTWLLPSPFPAQGLMELGSDDMKVYLLWEGCLVDVYDKVYKIHNISVKHDIPKFISFLSLLLSN